MSVKTCSRCKQEKDISSFGKCSTSKDGRAWYCFSCNATISRENRTQHKYASLFLKYNNACAVCGSKSNLEVHHANLKSQENIDDLMLLCKSCHLKIAHNGCWKRKAIVELSCKKCGHAWIPRKVDVRLCPKCKTAYFDANL